MAYNLDPNLEYFLGITLPRRVTEFLTQIRQELESREVLSSPPHITIKPPFIYHFEKPLVEQLAKWAKYQRVFTVSFKKIGSFKHKKYTTVYLTPERTHELKQLEQNLSQTIKFLPKETNFVPHLTVANRLAFTELESTKQKVRALDLSLELEVNNLTLFQHHRYQPWQIKEVYWFGFT